jgi:DNA mismatch repair protein MutL
MSDIIQLLPDAIANQIAAGEVVQRPASVIKELLENAVDAGASSIMVILKDAGRTLIQVIDDGKGMSPTDARMCFERHATSKIRKSEDLFQIRTMGFRGEAMASIAAVAQVEMRTRRTEDELATQIIIEASEVKLQEACQAPLGTNIQVKNLFYNVPARRNFLKANAVEMRHVMDEFERVAIANPEVQMNLHHNGMQIMQLNKGNLRQRLVGILGQNANKKLMPIEEDTEIMKINGFIGKPEFARKARGEQYFFVNDRFIKSAYLHHAVMSAYEDLLPSEHHPFYCIFLDLDPSKIDVNVHPTKQEIKFEDERMLYNILRVTVRHALGQFSISPTINFDVESGFEKQLHQQYTPPIQSGQKPLPSYTPTRHERDVRHDSNLKNWEKLYEGLDKLGSKANSPNDFMSDNPADDIPPAPEPDEWSVLPSLESASNGLDADGMIRKPYQIHNRYILSQIKSGFLLIDQQYAHERILYERFLRMLAKQKPQSQQLLFPVSLNLSPAEAEMLREILDEVNALGIDIREFGNQSFVVHGLPPEFKTGEEEKIIEQILNQYRMNLDLKLSAGESLARSLARSAAIKRGQSLSDEEMRELIDKLFACEMPFKTASGKKTFLTFDSAELERKFD